MSITGMENARHAGERGAILVALKGDYATVEMTSVRDLAGGLANLGRPMTTTGLQFSLALLADKGYVKIWRARDVPGWRSDRLNEQRGDAIMFARLTAQGLALIDGQAPEDPQVSF